MTIDEAAGLLGLSPATLRTQARGGSLRATKRGRDWWVTAREVERYRAMHLGQRGKYERTPGKARTTKLSPEQRRAIAQRAAAARWGKGAKA